MSSCDPGVTFALAPIPVAVAAAGCYAQRRYKRSKGASPFYLHIPHYFFIILHHNLAHFPVKIVGSLLSPRLL